MPISEEKQRIFDAAKDIAIKLKNEHPEQERLTILAAALTFVLAPYDDTERGLDFVNAQVGELMPAMKERLHRYQH